MSGYERHIRAMRERYPRIIHHGIKRGIALWKGPIQPIGPFSRDLEYLLDDLAHGRPVYGYDGGQLTHLSECFVDHCHHEWMDRIKDLSQNAVVAVEFVPDGSDPRCWVKWPLITKPKHMNGDGSICPFLSSGSTWSPDTDTVADFMPHVSIWLLKWMVYDQTDYWIGGGHGNTPQYHLTVLRPGDRCWCRSGLPYEQCCRPHDLVSTLTRRPPTTHTR